MLRAARVHGMLHIRRAARSRIFDYAMLCVRSDAVVVDVFLRDGGSIEALLVHDDGLFSGSLAGLQVLDDGVDVGSLEGVALAVVVPVAGEQLFKRPLVAVEAHDDDVLAHAVGDVRLVQSRNSALGHVVVFRVDDVEFLAGVDDGLDDLLGSLGVPLSGLLGHHVPVVVGSDLLVKSARAADLGSGTHDALDVDDVVGVEVLGSEPVNSGLAFLGHVGDDGSDIQALVSVDGAVEEDNGNTGLLGFLQHGVPAGGGSGGEQQVVHFVGDELLGLGNLLFILQGVEELGLVAVFLAEGGFHVSHVGSPVAGLGGVVVDDADTNQFVGLGRCKAGNGKNHAQRQGDCKQLFHNGYLFHKNFVLSALCGLLPI